MSAEVFAARWIRKMELRAQGFEELEDFLRHSSMGPLARLGLMIRKAERCCHFQRYDQHLPTEAGGRYLWYLPEEHLIVVRSDQVTALRGLLDRDPMPDAVYHGNFQPLGRMTHELRVEPKGSFTPQREDATRKWVAQRSAVLDTYMRHGYLDFAQFRDEHRLNERMLMACGFCRPRDVKQDHHRVPIVPMGEGCRFLQLEEEWDLLLIKPGLALQLLELMDPTQARYWTSCPDIQVAQMPATLLPRTGAGRG